MPPWDSNWPPLPHPLRHRDGELKLRCRRSVPSVEISPGDQSHRSRTSRRCRHASPAKAVPSRSQRELAAQYPGVADSQYRRDAGVYCVLLDGDDHPGSPRAVGKVIDGPPPQIAGLAHSWADHHSDPRPRWCSAHSALPVWCTHCLPPARAGGTAAALHSRCDAVSAGEPQAFAVSLSGSAPAQRIALLRSSQRSSMCSHPTLSRMSPGGTCC
jgi:hypothetical protein